MNVFSASLTGMRLADKDLVSQQPGCPMRNDHRYTCIDEGLANRNSLTAALERLGYSLRSRMMAVARM